MSAPPAPRKAVATWSADILSRNILFQCSYDLAKSVLGTRREFRSFVVLVSLWVVIEIASAFIDAAAAAGPCVRPAQHPGRAQRAHVPDQWVWARTVDCAVDIAGAVRTFVMSAVAYMATDAVTSPLVAGTADVLRCTVGLYVASLLLTLIDTARQTLVDTVRAAAATTPPLPPRPEP